MRLLIAILSFPALLGAQRPAAARAQVTATLTPADTQLVHAILAAEDRREVSSPWLEQGLRHRDERVRVLARRALGRIRDTLFTDRHWLPGPQPARAWPEDAWRARYRAMAAYRDACDVIVLGLRDSTWQVRLRAADMVRASCSGDDRVAAVLTGWIEEMPADVSRRAPGSVSWHAAAHAIVAMARIRPEEARRRMPALASHGQWHLRMYAARAAGIVGDTAALRRHAFDAHHNVQEAAVVGLSRLIGHSGDETYLAVLRGGADGAPAVRAAAIALKGSPRPDVQRVADSVYARWRARDNDSERDVRQALLEAAGRPPEAGVGLGSAPAVPREAAALALGADVRLSVEMAAESGGGTFVVRLRGDQAPIMGSRILQLVRSGHYDGGTWHRVEHDFVIQGGAHGDNEYVGHSRFLRDELGTLAHPRGTVGMSTRGHDTGDAQWFINLRDNARLVRDYTVFAEVVDGMGVVDGMMEGDVIRRVTILAAPGRPAGRSSTGRSSPGE